MPKDSKALFLDVLPSKGKSQKNKFWSKTAHRPKYRAPSSLKSLKRQRMFARIIDARMEGVSHPRMGRIIHADVIQGLEEDFAMKVIIIFYKLIPNFLYFFI
jgi:hypothetical protein